MAEYGSFLHGFGSSFARGFERELAREAESRRKVRGFKNLREFSQGLREKDPMYQEDLKRKRREARASTEKEMADIDMGHMISEFQQVGGELPWEDFVGYGTRKGVITGKQAISALKPKQPKERTPTQLESYHGRLRELEKSGQGKSQEAGDIRSAIKKGTTRAPRQVTPRRPTDVGRIVGRRYNEALKGHGIAGVPQIVKNRTQVIMEMHRMENSETPYTVTFEQRKNGWIGKVVPVGGGASSSTPTQGNPPSQSAPGSVRKYDTSGKRLQ